MSGICTTSDGNTIFMALEDGTGLPIIVKVSRSNLGTFTAAYNPGAGTASNVKAAPGDPDRVFFYGLFGSGVQVIEHAVAAASNTNISPTGLTTKIVNTLEIDPSETDRIIVTVDTDQDLLLTEDGGTTWDTLNAALGFNATALKVFWSGDYDYSRLVVAGQVTGAASLKYSPNEGASLSDITGANLVAAADVVGLEGVMA